MADDKSTSFEGSLQRLEQIVKALETEEPELERAVALYREGRDLIGRCEGLLKSAQQAIDAVNAPTARSLEDAPDGDAVQL
jgi:exodeoxyribonuclease VII small subunit